MFVVVELLKSVVEYIEVHRLELTFVIDAAVVFLLREVMIGAWLRLRRPRAILRLHRKTLLAVVLAAGIALMVLHWG